MVCGIWYGIGICSVFDYASHVSHSCRLQHSPSIPCPILFWNIPLINNYMLHGVSLFQEKMYQTV